jgi:hypothetical protein
LPKNVIFAGFCRVSTEEVISIKSKRIAASAIPERSRLAIRLHKQSIRDLMRLKIRQ